MLTGSGSLIWNKWFPLSGKHRILTIVPGLRAGSDLDIMLIPSTLISSVTPMYHDGSEPDESGHFIETGILTLCRGHLFFVFSVNLCKFYVGSC